MTKFRWEIIIEGSQDGLTWMGQTDLRAGWSVLLAYGERQLNQCFHMSFCARDLLRLCLPRSLFHCMQSMNLSTSLLA
jgi:hypothetical protein